MKSELPRTVVDLLNPENVKELTDRASEYVQPRLYADALARKYHKCLVFRTVFAAANVMLEPSTNQNDQRKARQMKKAFLTGNLLATEVIDIAGGGELVDSLASTPINFRVGVTQLTPADERKLAIAQMLLHGIESYQVATIFHPLIDTWGYKLAHRNQQETLRAGFGMVLNMGEAAIELTERVAFETAIEAGVDWNHDMRVLLGEQGLDQ